MINKKSKFKNDRNPQQKKREVSVVQCTFVGVELYSGGLHTHFCGIAGGAYVYHISGMWWNLVGYSFGSVNMQLNKEHQYNNM